MPGLRSTGVAAHRTGRLERRYVCDAVQCHHDGCLHRHHQPPGRQWGAGVCSACMSAAANAWNSACTPDQTPRFQQGGSGGIQVHVDFFSGTNPGTITGCSSDRCACTSTTISNGTITGATVRLWQSAAGTANCQGSWNGILTRQLGHALGLQDALACSTRIMGNVGAGILGADCDGADLNFLSGVHGIRRIPTSRAPIHRSEDDGRDEHEHDQNPGRWSQSWQRPSSGHARPRGRRPLYQPPRPGPGRNRPHSHHWLGAPGQSDINGDGVLDTIAGPHGTRGRASSGSTST